MAEHPPPDPEKLLAYWNEWERGDVSPGQVMANLKRGGLAEILQTLAATDPSAPVLPPTAPTQSS